jgi:hypothetical protein
MSVKLRVELVWEDDQKGASSSIHLTSDGQILLEGRLLTAEEREELGLPAGREIISVDRRLIEGIKNML